MGLRSAILAMSEALDPHHQGVQWPDPIAWDGRPLADQARDLLSLVDEYSDPAVKLAAAALRNALAKR
jgi:hypothetical protein